MHVHSKYLSLQQTFFCHVREVASVESGLLRDGSLYKAYG